MTRPTTPNDRLHSDNPMVLRVTQAPRVRYGGPLESSHVPRTGPLGRLISIRYHRRSPETTNWRNRPISGVRLFLPLLRPTTHDPNSATATNSSSGSSSQQMRYLSFLSVLLIFTDKSQGQHYNPPVGTRHRRITTEIEYDNPPTGSSGTQRGDLKETWDGHQTLFLLSLPPSWVRKMVYEPLTGNEYKGSKDLRSWNRLITFQGSELLRYKISFGFDYESGWISSPKEKSLWMGIRFPDCCLCVFISLRGRDWNRKIAFHVIYLKLQILTSLTL
jgi:hypothetical protein